MTTSVLFLSKFKENMIYFLDEMVESFNFPGFIIFRVMINSMPIETIMVEFIKNVIPGKQEVQNRSPEFFKTLSTVCRDDIKDTILCVYKVILSDTVDKDTKEVIWKWFDQFILLAERYVSTREKELLNLKN